MIVVPESSDDPLGHGETTVSLEKIIEKSKFIWARDIGFGCGRDPIP